MKIIRMNDIEGKFITQYQSNFFIRKILMTEKPSHAGIIYLEKDGHIGFHEANVRQILLVIEGDGWVRAGTDSKVKVTTGDAILWEKGEKHETFTDTGLKAIVIESDGLDINSF